MQDKKKLIKTALITGSSSGIGLAIARELAGQGFNIVINGLLPKQKCAHIVTELENIQKENLHNGKVLYVQADVCQQEEIKAMVHTIVSELGGVDIVINNAGIQHVAPISEFPEQKWHDVIATNLTSNFLIAKAVLPHMRKAGWGRVINIASAHGLVASAYKSAYVAAKHGVVGFTKALALETAEENITANAICPGYVLTPLVEKQVKDQAIAHNMPQDKVVREILLKCQPNKKFIHASSIGKMVCFLCSEAAEGMTGQVISMDGGWTAH